MSLDSDVNKTLNHFTAHAVATTDHQVAFCDITWLDAIHCCHNSFNMQGDRIHIQDGIENKCDVLRIEYLHQ
jgi:hypothetical protein